jgi:hypothetical protein
MRFSTTDGWYTGHRLYQPGYGALKNSPQLAATPSDLGSERTRRDFVPVQFVRRLDGA